MADKSAIEWTDATWNPVTGCTKVSPGCDHCYAETFAERWRGTPGHPYENGFDLTLRPERLDQPWRWKRPRRIFVNSMSDLFHDDVPDGMIAAVWFVMGQCAGLIPEQYRGHVFQILTKRHARMRSWLRKWADVGEPGIPPMDKAALRCGRAELIDQAQEFIGPLMYDWMDGPRYWPVALPGVWLGVSVENQQWADIRIPALLGTPAAVRWLSCEPLLGPVNLARYTGEVSGLPGDWERLIDWVVVGGESGHGARPMHPGWAERLRDQCRAAEVPYLFKQWGEWTPMAPLDKLGRLSFDGAHPMANDGTLYAPGDLAYPDGPRYGEALRADHGRAELTHMYRVGKKRAGRLLDGRTWDEYPAAANG